MYMAALPSFVRFSESSKTLAIASITEGALDAKTKELMALAIAVAVRCDGCIAFHVHDAVDAGATADEIAEAIGVAILMGGGPAAVYGADALRAYEEFTTQGQS